MNLKKLGEVNESILAERVYGSLEIIDRLGLPIQKLIQTRPQIYATIEMAILQQNLG